MSGQQQSLFAPQAPPIAADGAARKAAGVRRIRLNHNPLFDRLLTEAKRCSAVFGSVHNDNLRAMVELEGLSVPKNLYGAVWAQRGWREIGRRASTWPGCHAHKSGVYVWEGGNG